VVKFARQAPTFLGLEISLASFLKLYFSRLYWRPDDIKPPFFTVVKANVNSKLKVARLKELLQPFMKLTSSSKNGMQLNMSIY